MAPNQAATLDKRSEPPGSFELFFLSHLDTVPRFGGIGEQKNLDRPTRRQTSTTATMKRKHDQNDEAAADVPKAEKKTKKPKKPRDSIAETVEPAATPSNPPEEQSKAVVKQSDAVEKVDKESKSEKQQEKELSFSELGLDPRLVQAVAKQSYEKPTLVQRRAIPLALDGQDVLCKAKTGSGKTAAYVLPILSGILKRKSVDSAPSTSALILVPTRELADQVFKAIEEFSAFCVKDIQCVKLTDNVSDAVQKSLLANAPDVVISTPARAWKCVNSSGLSLDKLRYLVLDEADLILSFGYEEDMENLSRSMPKGVQTIMMSATLTPEVDTLKGLFCRSPKVLDLQEEAGAEDETLTQFVVKCGEDEKFLLAYLIFKLKLIKGSSLIFVSDVDRCYRLKLFFEQFGIRSCVLNSELPLNSRVHIIEEFNRNIYDLLIASENEVLGDEDKADKKEEKKGKKGDSEDKDGESKKKKKGPKRDQEYGVSRGIDFKNVAAVINFDLPTSASSYTHRIGRTARAGRTGMALSFYVPKELYRKHMPTSVKTAENDEHVLKKIIRQQAKQGREVKPYNFDKEQMDAFRYRMEDALRAVTKVAVREARTRELRQELIKSETLKRYVTYIFLWSEAKY
jgi:ATP-dependent RNA helicase DDX56/DBP9